MQGFGMSHAWVHLGVCGLGPIGDGIGRAGSIAWRRPDCACGIWARGAANAHLASPGGMPRRLPFAREEGAGLPEPLHLGGVGAARSQT